MATQVTLFPFNSLSVAEMPVALMAGTAPANGDNGRPPAHVVVQDPGVDLAKKTVCIKMRLSTMGNTRKVSTSQIEADADKDGRVSVFEAFDYARKETARSYDTAKKIMTEHAMLSDSLLARTVAFGGTPASTDAPRMRTP